jgi:hypothetical protein
MGESLADRLRDWHDFYLLIGTASATLIGLMFVAASIGASYFTAEREAGLKAFLTPTVLHFTAVLVTCLVATAPAHNRASFGVLLAAIGAVGIAYAIRVWLHMNRRGITSTIDLADRAWYVFTPLLVYLLLGCAGLTVEAHVATALVVLSASVVLLLLVGIRNAWDMTVWIVIRAK